MPKRCPECRNINEDTRSFCAFCGATLDANLRLIQELERQIDRPQEQELPPKPHVDVKMYTPRSTPQKREKKKSAAPWILLGLVVIAIAVWFFLR